MSTSKPLADRLPAESLAALQQVGSDRQLEHRPALRRHYTESTLDHYRYRMARYRAWCRRTSRQADLMFLDDATAEEYVRHQITDLTYHPRTIMQSLNALKYEAQRAGRDPVPAMRSAYELLRTYATAVAALLADAATAQTPDESSS
jgi:hypothetical protein